MFDHHSRDGGDKSPGPQLALSPFHGLGGWTAEDTPDAAAVRFRTVGLGRKNPAPKDQARGPQRTSVGWLSARVAQQRPPGDVC
jgi:hypothetical protein